jgi:hypothetical protein
MTDRSWTCEICGQTLVWLKGATVPKLPPKYFDTCKLQRYMVGTDCIAFRDLRRARQLIRNEKMGGARPL